MSRRRSCSAFRSAQRDRILAVLKLAEELGAATAVLAGDDTAAELVAQAQRLNCAILVLGRPQPSRLPWGLGGRTLTRRLALLAPTLDIVEVGHAEARAAWRRAVHRAPAEEGEAAWHEAWPGYAWAAAASVAITLR